MNAPLPPHVAVPCQRPLTVAAAAAADARRLGGVHRRRVRAVRARAGVEPAAAGGHPFHLSDYWVTLVGKIMCYAIVALAMDLIWGYAGILSLGHGLFFALGGYAMGMYLMRSIGHDGVYQSDLPDFMVFLDWKAYPVVLELHRSLLVRGAARRARARAARVRLRLLRVPLADQGRLFLDHHAGADVRVHAALLPQRHGFGGNNGFTDFKRILGFPIAAPGDAHGALRATGVALLGALLLGRYIVTSKLGRVLTAIRDAESRVMFCGYNPLHYKLFVWTLSAVLCGIAGALYVPQVGIINPSEMSPANSIEIAIWAAVGGRGTLIGPIVGAFVVNGAKSWFTEAFPEYWLFFLGLLFILVTLFLPQGVIGLLRRRR